MDARLWKLSRASDNYQHKIDSSYFAGKKSEGKKRLQKSKDLKKFAADSKKMLAANFKGQVCPDDTIEAIGNRNKGIINKLKGENANEIAEDASSAKAMGEAGANPTMQGENALPKEGEYVNLDEALEEAKGEIVKEAGKNGIGEMDKENCIKPLACITAITFMKNQEKLIGASLNYTKENFNKELEKMEGSEEFKRTMSDFSPEQIYSRAKNNALLINDISHAKNVIAEEKKKREETNKGINTQLQGGLNNSGYGLGGMKNG